MLDIQFEKEKQLSTQEHYEIIDFAIQAAYDDGFMNSFIFQRALYVFSAILLAPDYKEEISEKAAQNINDAWDFLIEENILDYMVENSGKELDALADEGRLWFEEYSAYTHSARGLLDNLQRFTGSLAKDAFEQLQTTASQTDLQKVLDIGEKWGMNNGSSAFGDGQLFTTVK